MKSAKELMLAYIGRHGGTVRSFVRGHRDARNCLISPRSGCRPSSRVRPRSRNFSAILHGQLYPGFAFEQVKVHLDTPDQAFAEYHINHTSGISHKDVKQQFFGHLEAKDGKIMRLREAIDVVVAAEAIYPNGLG